jgi:hypothetical protein
MLAWWRTSKMALDFDALRTHAQDIFEVGLAVDALIRLTERGDVRRKLSRRALTHSWLEVREVEAKANIVGTVHTRYGLGNVEMDGQAARDFAAALRAAWVIVQEPAARLAFKDYGQSLAQRGDDAFLYAFRAIENVRRSCAPDTVKANGDVQPHWGEMHTALGTSEEVLRSLTDAAVAIRHGDTGGDRLVEVRDEPQRESTLALADDVLRRFIVERELVSPWPPL